MARDPDPRRPDTETLESTTAMPSVSPVTMQNVGRRAAKMADAVAHSQDTILPGKKSSRKAPLRVPDGAPSEAIPAASTAPVVAVARPIAEAAREAIKTADIETADMDAGIETGATVTETVLQTVDDARPDVALAVETMVPPIETEPAPAHAAESLAPPAEPGAGPRDAASAFADLNDRVAEAVRRNIEATVSFWTSLLEARSLSQAADLNRRHLQRQMDAFASQSRDLAALAHRLSLDAVDALAGRLGRSP